MVNTIMIEKTIDTAGFPRYANVRRQNGKTIYKLLPVGYRLQPKAQPQHIKKTKALSTELKNRLCKKQLQEIELEQVAEGEVVFVDPTVENCKCWWCRGEKESAGN